MEDKKYGALARSFLIPAMSAELSGLGLRVIMDTSVHEPNLDAAAHFLEEKCRDHVFFSNVFTAAEKSGLSQQERDEFLDRLAAELGVTDRT